MRTRITLSTIVLSLLCSAITLGQLSVNNVSANLGTIRTLVGDDDSYSEYRSAFYPELQIGGSFFTRAAGWTIYWCYWTDGIERALPVADMITYSFTSHIVGTRLTFFPAQTSEHWALPVGIFAGVSHHFIAGRNVGGSGIIGKPGEDFTRTSNTVEIGLNIRFPIVSPLSIRGEVQQFVRIDNDDFDRRQKNRRAY
jgi:hypothetical protein